jgi:hypothetical protein
VKVIDRILAISGEKETSPAEVDGKRLGGWWERQREKHRYFPPSITV